MTEVFIVFQQGVYRHACGGAFSTSEAAILRIEELIAADRDSYHSYEVVPFILDHCGTLAKDRFSSDFIYEPTAIFSRRKVIVVE